MCLDDNIIKSGIHSFASVTDSLNCIRIWKNAPGFKAIVNKENSCLLGMICLADMNRYTGYMELEYAIAEKYRNKGYVAEAVNCMTDQILRSALLWKCYLEHHPILGNG